MTTKTCLLSLFLLFVSSCVSAKPDDIQDYPVSEIPEELKKGANAVIREWSEVFRIVNPGEGVLEGKKVITILNQKGKGFSTAYVTFDKTITQGTILRGEVYNAAGKRVTTIKSKDLQEESLIGGSFIEGKRVLYAEMSYASYPYTIMYTYRKRYKGLFSPPEFYPQRSEKLAIQQASYELIHAPGYRISYQVSNMEDNVKIYTDQAGKHVKWSVNNLKSIKKEPFSPPLIELVPSVQLSLGNFELQGYEGNMENWENFGRFMYELNEDRDELPKALREELDDLLIGTRSPQEVIDITYRYLQEHTRYVSIQLGIGGWQTFSASYVYENGYGDCKALSNYMKGMLQFAGITSYLAIISAGNDPSPIDPGFATNSFNHMILCVPLENDTVWLECTADNHPAGYLGDFTADRYALLATPEGGKLVRTPKRDPRENVRSRSAHVKIGKDGHAQVQSKRSYTEYLIDTYADVIGSGSGREQENYIRRTIAPGSFDLIAYQRY